KLSTATEDYSRTFFLNLESGLNMISLPLKPLTQRTARDLMNEIGATMAIKLDAKRSRFVGFTETDAGDGFPIEGGQGYIVNVKESKVVPFIGAAWTNEPPVEAAPPAESNPSGWAFIVSGAMLDSQGSDYTVTVRNLRTGAVATDSIADGRFNVVFADLNRNTVIEASDKVELIIRDSSNKIVAGPVTYQIGQEDIRKAFRDIVIPYSYARPEKNVLLQNYPNPFNPETWIPFQLAQDADVSVRIYDAGGKLIRALSLGHREAGFYVEKGKAVYWNGKSDAGEEVASGVYFYSIKAGDFSATRKLIIGK
ncbi:MAG: FlgD immunoglobulin-like domain containing protein, partial [Candidatus Poribacteria bacterium]